MELVSNTNVDGYVAAVLSPESHEQLKQLVRHPHPYCHHLTIYFKPPQELYDRYLAPRLGETVTLQVIGLLENDRGQAVLVEPLVGFPANRQAHVTLSCADGVRPAYSNELMNLVAPTPLDLKLQAIIQFIPNPPRT